jgi:DNA-binding SARP family transcriptional activator/predicted ATPase/ABC-type glycerol-3-phosphate transport system substrate-binding protein
MLELSLLGSPSAILDRTALGDTLLHKDLALLYYLAVCPGPQPRSVLAALLWGDLSEPAARANLRKSLSDLRLHLGSTLDIGRETVELPQVHCRADVWDFERRVRNALASADIAQLQSAIALYRGDFLSGFAVHNAPDFDHWVYATAARLRTLAVTVLTTMATRLAAAGDLDSAIAAHRRVLDLEPWCEESHRALMLLLLQSGQRSNALAQYRRCVEVLASELGVRPAAETAALAARICGTTADSSAPTVPVRSLVSSLAANPLPSELSPIVGRERELDELAALLCDPTCRAITILGEGGIGKTRLALALAHRLAARFEHVAFVSLAAATSPDDILSTVGRAFHITASGSAEVVLDALRQGSRNLLLVLDAFEHLLPGGVDVLDQALRNAPDLRCVVTSRAVLHTSWEWRYPLAELSYPGLDTTADPGDYDSVQLFLQVAHHMRPRQPIAGAELQHVMQICRLVGGMPLGVELAASQLGGLPCALIAERLATGIEQLAADLRDLPVRQRSLQASFDASWASLSTREQGVLARLSVIHGAFTLEAAIAIAQATDTDLLHLVDKSLVRAMSHDSYSLHEAIKQFAERRLAVQGGEPQAGLERYCDFCLAWTEQNLHQYAAPRLRGQELLDRLENHVQHLWHVWAHSSGLSRRSSVAIALTEAELARSAYIIHSQGVMKSWQGVDDFVRFYADSSLLYSGAFAVDIAWLAWVTDRLTDITDNFAQQAELWLPQVADACRVCGRLFAAPKDFDLGLLYYRTDLLAKYGFAAPPATWDELGRMAAVIQAGERAAGHDEFWGFIWAGHQSESLTCTALEWQHAEGGGLIVEDDGHISVANERVAAAMERAARWVGTISPPNFDDFAEGETARAWERGEAAFMRLWGAYSSLLLQSEMNLCTQVGMLPHGSVRRAATLGGWPLAVHNSLYERQEAIALAKEMSSPAVQRLRALRTDFCLPAVASLYHDPDVLAANPLLADVAKLIEEGGLAIRPTNLLGVHYAQVSTLYAETVAMILRKEVQPLRALTALADRLASLNGIPAA